MYDYRDDKWVQETEYKTISNFVNDIVLEVLKLRRFENVSIFTSYDALVILLEYLKEALGVQDLEVANYVTDVNKSIIICIDENFTINTFDAFDQNKNVINTESEVIYIDDTVCLISELLQIEECYENIMIFTLLDD